MKKSGNIAEDWINLSFRLSWCTDRARHVCKTYKSTLRDQHGSTLSERERDIHIFHFTKSCQNAVRGMSTSFPECYLIRANGKEVDSSAPSSSTYTHTSIAVSQPCLSTHYISNQAWQRTPQVSSVLTAALGPSSQCVLHVCECASV